MHSVADSGNQVLLLIGRSRAQREETEEHQFGFGAERYFYAFIVAVVLFTVGAVFSVYEGVDRIRHPEKLTSPVRRVRRPRHRDRAGEPVSLRTAVKESNRSRGRARWRSFIRHAKAPELPAVLLEDVAALSGLLLALIGVVAGDDHPRRRAGTAPARWPSACCSAASPWCWRRRRRAC